MLITRRLKPDRILREVDWNLLVMFSGLFILTKATEQLNLLEPLTKAIGSSAGLIASQQCSLISFQMCLRCCC
ncbi:SLC13 family permease [Phormidesmis priestleyi]